MKDTLKKALSDNKVKLFMAVTGGGAGAIADILCSGGASKFFIGAYIPYGGKSIEKFLGVNKIEHYCTEEMARQLAVASFEECRKLATGDPVPNMVNVEYKDVTAMWGISCTAALAKEGERPDRANKAYIACHGLKGTFTDTLEFDHSWVKEGVPWQEARLAQEQRLANHIINDVIPRILDYCGA